MRDRKIRLMIERNQAIRQKHALRKSGQSKEMDSNPFPQKSHANEIFKLEDHFDYFLKKHTSAVESSKWDFMQFERLAERLENFWKMLVDFAIKSNEKEWQEKFPRYGEKDGLEITFASRQQRWQMIAKTIKNAYQNYPILVNSKHAPYEAHAELLEEKIEDRMHGYFYESLIMACRANDLGLFKRTKAAYMALTLEDKIAMVKCAVQHESYLLIKFFQTDADFGIEIFKAASSEWESYSLLDLFLDPKRIDQDVLSGNFPWVTSYSLEELTIQKDELKKAVMELRNAIYPKHHLGVEQGALREQFRDEYVLSNEAYIFSLRLVFSKYAESQQVSDKKKALNLLSNLVKIAPLSFQVGSKKEINNSDFSAECSGEQFHDKMVQILQLREKQNQFITRLQLVIKEKELQAEKICQIMETPPFEMPADEKPEPKAPALVGIIRCRTYLAHLAENPLSDISSFERNELKETLEEANKILTKRQLKLVYLSYQAGKKDKAIQTILFLLEIDYRNKNALNEAIALCSKNFSLSPNEKIYQQLMNLLNRAAFPDQSPHGLFNQYKMHQDPAMGGLADDITDSVLKIGCKR